MSPRLFWAFLGSISLLVLTISPVSAAPSLSLGNHANYTLSGVLHASESCTADQAQYMSQACGFGGPPQPQSFNVFWYDYASICYPNNSSCTFSPAFLSIPSGSVVQWSHVGNLTHTVTANATLNGYVPYFDSGSVPRGSTYEHVFSTPANYHYYCAIHPWMKGEVDVYGVQVQPQQPSMPSVRVNLDGSVNWTVRGLSADTANLKVDHKVAVSISPEVGALVPVSFTPLTEKGSFEQSIALATRVESPGTASSIIEALARTLPAYLNAYSGAIFPSSIGYSAYSQIPGLNPDSPSYTMWWVNGPLSLGSPVSILMGSSSVTGSENLNLGTSLGTRAGWLVTSQFSQSVNVTAPSPTTSSSRVSSAFNLLWSFDKSSDVLLRSDANIPVSIIMVSTQDVYSNPCYPGYCPTNVPVMVTRTVTASMDLALRLASTDLVLKNSPNATTLASTLQIMANIPWLPLGVTGAVAAGIVGSGVWYTRRGHGKAPEPGSPPPVSA